MKFYLKIAALLSPLALLSACIGIPPTESPIPSIGAIRGDSPNSTLVIMLPGRGDRADIIIANGFQEEGERLAFDTVAVDAHFGYYMKRSLLPRLREDFILPAKAAGYDNIWLLGVSMGGFGSLLYANEYPGEIDGIVLLAPYLGDPDLAREIDAGGGLAAWSGDGPAFKSYEIGVWKWLQDTTNARSGTPVILGYGEADDGAKTFAVLADALEDSSVYTREGGHDWITWRPLWNEIATDLKF